MKNLVLYQKLWKFGLLCQKQWYYTENFDLLWKIYAIIPKNMKLFNQL